MTPIGPLAALVDTLTPHQRVLFTEWLRELAGLVARNPSTGQAHQVLSGIADNVAAFADEQVA